MTFESSASVLAHSALDAHAVVGALCAHATLAHLCGDTEERDESIETAAELLEHCKRLLGTGCAARWRS